MKQREIKFRAWDGSRMRTSFVVHSASGAAIIGGVGGIDVVNWQIMQYTGLKDRNGKEIYEGDVVMCCDLGTSGDFICNSVVEWCNDEIGWTLIPDPTRCDRYDLFRNIEVIGNIYENPELKGE